MLPHNRSRLSGHGIRQAGAQDFQEEDNPRPGPSVEQVIPGEEVVLPAGVRFYRVQRRVIEVAPWAASLADGLVGTLSSPRLCASLPAFRGQEVFLQPEEVLFLDLETTGLGTTPLFLVGMLVFQDSDLVARQYLARSFEEETAVLLGFREIMKPIRLLITFNGKSFDVHYVMTRAQATGVDLPPGWADAHLDMLFRARALYRNRLPNCQLQTLEYFVCGRKRQGDIPGYAIPGVYHKFLRTGDASRLALVLHHNLLDLITVADLVARLMPDS